MKLKAIGCKAGADHIFVTYNYLGMIFRMSRICFLSLKKQPFSNNMVPFTSLFIDDLCVDAKARGQHIGESLFEYVKSEAKRLGCYEVILNVWAGNTSAEKFYEKMGLKTKERQMEYILEH